jgi:hypothetical protein
MVKVSLFSSAGACVMDLESKNPSNGFLIDLRVITNNLWSTRNNLVARSRLASPHVELWVGLDRARHRSDMDAAYAATMALSTAEIFLQIGIDLC